MEEFYHEDEFPVAIFMPLMKSMDGDEEEHAYKHRGILSTEEKDQDGEFVLQDQMDLSYFLNKGYFNWNHRPDPANVVGVPTRAEVTELGAVPFYQLKPGQTGREQCVYIEGVLFKGVKQAEDIWSLMQTLEKSGRNRSLGYSAQGGISARRGNILTKTYVRHAAITHEPTNASTLATLAKSLHPELETPECFSYDCLTSFQKAMIGRTYSDVNPGVKDLTRLALGMTSCEKGHHNGTEFMHGRVSVKEHLTKCIGWNDKDANDYLLMLYRNIQ